MPYNPLIMQAIEKLKIIHNLDVVEMFILLLLLSKPVCNQITLLCVIASSLTNLYHLSDMRCCYEQKDKVLVVKPFVQKFKLSPDAREYYKNVHNEFEFDVAKKYEDDAFISGKLKLSKIY